MVLVAHSVLEKERKLDFVKPGYTAQILPQRHLGQAVSFPKSKEEREMITIETN